MNRLTEVRQAQKLTKTQLAAAVGVSERHICFIESGDRTPSIKLAQSIASTLSTTVDYLFLSTDSTNSTVDESRDVDAGANK